MRWSLWPALVLMFALAGCEAPAPTAPSAVNFAVTGKPASLHPVLASDALSERIAALLYAPLVEFDATQQPIPGQIRWQRESPTQYRLTLQAQSSAFSDGRKPDAADVVATLNAARRLPASGFAGALAHLAKITQLDNEQVRVELTRPDPRFPEKLHIGLLPAEWATQTQKLAQHPAGNGPFEFIAWTETGVQLRRRSDGLRVTFEAVADPTMRALKLMRGETQIVQNDMPGEIVDYLAALPAVQRESIAGSTFSYLGFNLADPITGERRVRQAIAHAIDRQAIVHALFKDQASLAETLLPRQHWAAAQALAPYAYDPKRSLSLLAELGYTPEQPLVISYKTSTDPFRLRIAAVLQAQLAKVGIALRIQSYEWGTFFGDIKAGRFQMYSLSWVGIRTPDIFRHIYHSHSLPPTGANRGRYRSPTMDALIEQAEQAPTRLAVKLYREIQQRAHRQLIYVPLWHEHQQLLSRGLHNVHPNVLGSYQFLERVSLANE